VRTPAHLARAHRGHREGVLPIVHWHHLTHCRSRRQQTSPFRRLPMLSPLLSSHRRRLCGRGSTRPRTGSQRAMDASRR